MATEQELLPWVRLLRQMGRDLGIGSSRTKQIEDALMPLLARSTTSDYRRGVEDAARLADTWAGQLRNAGCYMTAAGAEHLAIDVRALLTTEQGAPQCLWTEDMDGIWSTSCGEMHQFTVDGPAENKQKFCGYCGKELVVAPVVETADAKE